MQALSVFAKVLIVRGVRRGGMTRLRLIAKPVTVIVTFLQQMMSRETY
jgi:hypothetical protein